MSQRFEFTETDLAGLFTVGRKPIADERGFFARFFCAQEFRSIGFVQPIVQMNHTLTRKRGAVRGMHFQHPPHAETKIVSCIRGEVLDVAVDIRKGSPSFLRWHAEVLSAENQMSLFIPEGFAHGFQALTDDCELLYLHSKAYEKDAQGALHVEDARLLIEWSLDIAELSERDRGHAMIGPEYEGVDLR